LRGGAYGRDERERGDVQVVNPDYVKLAEARLADKGGLFA
jgi:hypothetical protein